MRSDIKARWVADLRSGKYQQGQGALNHGGKFCCLGVLCELAVADGVVEKRLQSNGYTTYGTEAGGFHDSVLPSDVVRWAELGYCNPVVAEGPDGIEEGVAAAEANDELHWSFDEIADAVEEYL